MKKITILGAVLIAMFITSSAPAHAGILDWLKSPDNKVVPGEIVSSFDKLYRDIKDPTLATLDSATQSGFISETNTPSVSKAPIRVSAKTYRVSISAYSSTVDQTDASPFITASGTFVRDGIVAANFLPIGTLIRIPDMYGNKVFTVEDRMNRRYWYNVDIWFATREAAQHFGRRTLTIEVI